MHHKTGRLVTQNRQHIKLTPISAKQYLCNQLYKHIKTDPLESILNQINRQLGASNDNTNIVNGPVTNNPTPEHSTTDMDNNHEKSEENNEHNISEKSRPVNRNINQNYNHNIVTRMRYGRIVQKTG